MFAFTQKYPEGYQISYYKCSSKSHKGTSCASLKKQIATKRVDPVIWGWISSLLEDENNLDEGIRAIIEKRETELGPKKERVITIESLLTEADEKIKRLVDELAEYEGYAVRDAISEKILSIENERSMLFSEWERLSSELEQTDLSQDFESQRRRTAEIIRKSLKGATFEDKRRVFDLLDLQVRYLYDENRGEILQVSCMIPIGDGAIELSPSSRTWCSLPRI